MALSVGIVGLPNVGKSTFFNALTHAQNAAAENYPFCTIEPNKAMVPVHDARLAALAEIVNPKQIVKATVDFIDIAGLVRGASKGEGRGNAFLSDIRDTNAVLHVVRCFNDEEVVHVDGSVDPIRDIQTIETELILADLDTVSKHRENISRKAHADPKMRPALAAMEELEKHLDAGNPARTFVRDEASPILEDCRQMRLLTDKPVIYVANVGEDDLGEEGENLAKVRAYAAERGCDVIVISAKMEADMAGLSDEERAEFLQSYGLEESGLDRTARTAYHTLGLASYFTAGPKEVKAWTFRRGWKAPKCAGVIHTDFERGFIRAEVVSFDDYIAHRGTAGARSAGLLRSEGKEYEMKDGDVVEFLFNV